MPYKPKPREQALEKVIEDIFYMARRYAHGRHTYAPSIVRDAYWTLRANGVEIKKDDTIKPPLDKDIRSDYLDDIN